jgi:hypothetical protein
MKPTTAKKTDNAAAEPILRIAAGPTPRTAEAWEHVFRILATLEDAPARFECLGWALSAMADSGPGMTASDVYENVKPGLEDIRVRIRDVAIHARKVLSALDPKWSSTRPADTAAAQ